MLFFVLLQGMSSVFFNKGENCIAAGRLFVEDSIHDEFVARVIEECKKMVSCYLSLSLSLFHFLDIKVM